MPALVPAIAFALAAVADAGHTLVLDRDDRLEAVYAPGPEGTAVAYHLPEPGPGAVGTTAVPIRVPPSGAGALGVQVCEAPADRRIECRHFAWLSWSDLRLEPGGSTRIFLSRRGDALSATANGIPPSRVDELPREPGGGSPRLEPRAIVSGAYLALLAAIALAAATLRRVPARRAIVLTAAAVTSSALALAAAPFLAGAVSSASLLALPLLPVAAALWVSRRWPLGAAGRVAVAAVPMLSFGGIVLLLQIGARVDTEHLAAAVALGSAIGAFVGYRRMES